MATSGPVKTGQRALLRVEGLRWAEHRMELSGGLVPGALEPRGPEERDRGSLAL